MAAVPHPKPFPKFSTPEARSPAPSGSLKKANPDYFALVVLLLIMGAIMALAMWLASFGGGSVEPMDYWMLTP